MKIISLVEIEYVSHRLAQEMMGWNESIPSFDSRYPNVLESSLSVPFQKFGGKYLYKGFIRQASVLFYVLIKNHPFENGNKRIAMTTLFYCLYKNGKWIEIDNQELYNFAKWVASSPPKLKNETVAAIEKFIKSYLINI